MGQEWYRTLKACLGPVSEPDLPTDGSVLSSVMIAIGWNPESSCDEILLTKRPFSVATHKGQVCFPGGTRELEDSGLLATALRESFEEVGTKADDLEVLGRLTPVRTRFGTWIVPWVARIKLPYEFHVNPSEVDRLLFLPLNDLMTKGLIPVRVPVDDFWVESLGIDVSDELVWGVTASMLYELRKLLVESGGRVT